MITKYETEVTNIGGRNGKVFSSDKTFSMDIESPIITGVKNAAATNPEQLFAAGYSSCFNSALESAMRRNKVSYESSTVTAFVSLLYNPEDQGHEIGVRLQVSIKGISLEEARKYVAVAHTRCPYSKAIRGNVDVKIEVVDSE